MTILTLWLPILVSAVGAFIAGSVIWMAMPWHKTDWKKSPDEDTKRAALRDLAPGQYSMPHCKNGAEMKSPEFVAKMKEGPVAFITVKEAGEYNMGPALLQMFIYNLAVAIVCAYFVSRTLPMGADYLAVFRIAGTTAFIAYGMAYVQESIWFGRSWKMTFNNFIDALIYAGITGGIFGWLV